VIESSLEVTTRETAQNALVWVDIFVSQDPHAVSPVSPDYDMVRRAARTYKFERSGM